jgi:hypothetical protein
MCSGAVAEVFGKNKPTRDYGATPQETESDSRVMRTHRLRSFPLYDRDLEK